jgi:holo-[acyl-carrier protein] synthase
MLVGTGVDAVEIERVRRSIERFGEQFISRIFTEQEAAYCLKKRTSAESFAARFAAKEAGAKALGTGIARGVSWRELEVERLPGQRPTLRLHGRALAWADRLGVRHVALAITHTNQLAIATVHLEGGP